MDKQILKDLMLGCVYPFKYLTDGHCVSCKVKSNNLCTIRFTYSVDTPDQIIFDILMCNDCYLKKIASRPLEELKTIIPLLKIRKDIIASDLKLYDNNNEEWKEGYEMEYKENIL